jgi:hypothetical protein
VQLSNGLIKVEGSVGAFNGNYLVKVENDALKQISITDLKIINLLNMSIGFGLILFSLNISKLGATKFSELKTP